jgi:hypothetical protein
MEQRHNITWYFVCLFPVQNFILWVGTVAQMDVVLFRTERFKINLGSNPWFPGRGWTQSLQT